MQPGADNELEEQLRNALAAKPMPEENEPLPEDFQRQTATMAHQQFQVDTLSAVRSLNGSGVPRFLEPSDREGDLGRLGSYSVIREVGRGGMGIVYEAVDVQLQRRVALKIMSPNVSGQTDQHTRFLREARAAAGVEHPNICPVYQVGESGGIFFIAMPFLMGESLEQRLNRDSIPLPEALSIGQQIAKALAAAHQAGLVHRDIKPSNVWIENDNDGLRVRLLDFGLARREHEEVMVTREGMILGTPAYMAPEQARGELVDGRADLFSLGVVLYEMVTTKRPFEGKDVVMILTKLATHTPLPPSRLKADVPEPVSGLIMQMLAKSPEDRPRSASQIASELDKLLKDLSGLIEAEKGNESATNNANQQTLVLSDTAVAQAASSTSQANAILSPAHAPPGNRIRNGVIALAFGFGFFLLASIYFMSIKTKNGTLEVEVSSDVDIRARDGKLLIYDDKGELKYTISMTEQQSPMPPGKYLAKIQGADGVELESSEFEMKKDGVAKVRVVAKAPEPSSPPTTTTPAVAALAPGSSFPGKLVFSDDFEQPDQTKYPVIQLNNEIRRLIDGRYECQFTTDYAIPVAVVPVGPVLMDGALHYRIRRINCNHFLNFRAVNDGKKVCWLTLSIRANKWFLTLQRQNKEGNEWKPLPSVTILEGSGFSEDIVDGKWLDLSVRWSRNDYAIWINNQLATRGSLDEWPELQVGERQADQICIRRNGSNTMQLQVDWIELYDQSALPAGEARDRLPASTTAGQPK